MSAGNIRNIRLDVEYDGTAYHGWQSQTNAVTVQNVLKDALRTLTSEDIALTGSGRTDTGVHAVSQTVNFKTCSNIPAGRFAAALNSLLPADITVNSSHEADSLFNARYSAKGKSYRYLMYNSPYPSALLRNRAWHVRYQLDADAMDQAAQLLIGTHDFTSFMASGSKVKDAVRTLYISRCHSGESYITGLPLLAYEVRGNGFLYNMVRIITGTLVDVGRGKISPEDVKGILEARDRGKAGKTAPPQGLYLVTVHYDE